MNVGFWSYLKSLQVVPFKRKDRIFILTVVYMCIFGFSVSAVCNTGVFSSFIIGAGAFLGSVSVLLSRQNRPNISTMLPLTPRRRAVYELCATFLFFAFFIVVTVGAYFLSVFIFGLFVLPFPNGHNVFAELFHLFTVNITHTFENAYSTAVLVSVTALIIGAGLVYSHIDRERNRNIFAACSSGLTLAGALVLAQVTLDYRYDSSSFVWNTDVGYYIKFMPHGGLAIALIVTAAAAMLAAGVCMVIVKNRAKNY